MGMDTLPLLIEITPPTVFIVAIKAKKEKNNMVNDYSSRWPYELPRQNNFNRIKRMEGKMSKLSAYGSWQLCGQQAESNLLFSKLCFNYLAQCSSVWSCTLSYSTRQPVLLNSSTAYSPPYLDTEVTIEREFSFPIYLSNA